MHIISLSYLNACEQELLITLARNAVSFAVIGGHAVLCYSPAERPDGTFRTLGDLDVLISHDPENLGRLSRALAVLRIVLSPEALAQIFASEQLPNLCGGYHAQLFPQIAGVTTDAVLEESQLANSSVGFLPVISLDHLIAAKKASGRPKDLDDVAALEAISPNH